MTPPAGAGGLGHKSDAVVVWAKDVQLNAQSVAALERRRAQYRASKQRARDAAKRWARWQVTMMR